MYIENYDHVDRTKTYENYLGYSRETPRENNFTLLPGWAYKMHSETMLNTFEFQGGGGIFQMMIIEERTS